MPALLEIWLYASSRKPMFMPSMTTRRPVIAAPMPMPMKPFSARAHGRVSGPSTWAHMQERLLIAVP
jgi:hypothetical protein